LMPLPIRNSGALYQPQKTILFLWIVHPFEKQNKIPSDLPPASDMAVRAILHR